MTAIFTRLVLFALITPALATPALAEDKTPLEITADHALEWDQNAKTYTAKGNALAKQGDMAVHADTLTATYDDATGNNSSNITKLVADGHVSLQSGTNTATGDKVTYDLVKGEAVLTGNRPKIIQTDKNNSLEADTITIWTEKNEASGGKVALKNAEAKGNVVILSGQQKATGDTSTYVAATNISELLGHVRIAQDKNWLEGDHATMNLTTHINSMTSQNGKGQVKGVFYTGSQKQQAVTERK